MSALVFTACDKNENNTNEPNATVADFVGSYDATITSTTYIMNQPYSDTSNATMVIAATANEGGVTITMDGESLPGTVDKEGLHIATQSVTSDGVTVTVIFPVIAAPKNGKLTWTSTFTATGEYEGQPISYNGSVLYDCKKL